MKRMLLSIAFVIALVASAAGPAPARAQSATWTCPQTEVITFPKTVAIAGCSFASTTKTTRIVCTAKDQAADRLKVRVTLIHGGSGATLASCAVPRDSRNATTTTSKSRSKPSKWAGSGDAWTLIVRVELLDTNGQVTRTVDTEYTVPAGYPVYL